jgi:hypothetical protein
MVGHVFAPSLLVKLEAAEVAVRLKPSKGGGTLSRFLGIGMNQEDLSLRREGNAEMGGGGTGRNRPAAALPVIIKGDLGGSVR